MTPRRHGADTRIKPPPISRSWANESDIMANVKGWAKRDNERYLQRLREDRLYNQSLSEDRETPEVPGYPEITALGGIPRLDADGELARVLPLHLCNNCTGGVHDRCYRVVCNCPCYWDTRDKKVVKVNEVPRP